MTAQEKQSVVSQGLKSVEEFLPNVDTNRKLNFVPSYQYLSPSHDIGASLEHAYISAVPSQIHGSHRLMPQTPQAVLYPSPNFVYSNYAPQLSLAPRQYTQPTRIRLHPAARPPQLATIKLCDLSSSDTTQTSFPVNMDLTHQNGASNGTKTSPGICNSDVNVQARVVRDKFEKMSPQDKIRFFEAFKKKKLHSVVQFYGNFSVSELACLHDYISLELEINPNVTSIGTQNFSVYTRVTNQHANITNIDGAGESARESKQKPSFDDFDVSHDISGNSSQSKLPLNSTEQRIPKLETQDNFGLRSKEDTRDAKVSVSTNVNNVSSNDPIELKTSEMSEEDDEENIKQRTEVTQVSNVNSQLAGNLSNALNGQSNQILSQTPRTRAQHAKAKSGSQTGQQEEDVYHRIKCPVKGCDKEYVNRKGLTAHLQKHGQCPEIPFKCPHCPFVSDRQTSIQKHNGKLHSATAIRKLTCNSCKRKFQTLKQLGSHLRSSKRNGRCSVSRAARFASSK